MCLAGAGEYVEKGRLDSAISEVKAQIDENPASAEAHDMLVSLYLRKQDTIGYRKAPEARCDLRIQIDDPEGGHESWERASSEYEQLAEPGLEKRPPWLH